MKYWFFSPLILRNIEYGRGSKYRNLLDIYLPLPINPSKEDDEDSDEKPKQFKDGFPVVIFVSGGAWTIGEFE